MSMSNGYDVEFEMTGQVLSVVRKVAGIDPNRREPSQPGLETVKTVTPNPVNRSVRLNYPSEYMATVRITKTERGANAPNSRAPISYIIQECYPYAIDAVPLSYGTSQITKVTANFYYRKHSIVYNDISGYRG